MREIILISFLDQFIQFHKLEMTRQVLRNNVGVSVIENSYDFILIFSAQILVFIRTSRSLLFTIIHNRTQDFYNSVQKKKWKRQFFDWRLELLFSTLFRIFFVGWVGLFSFQTENDFRDALVGTTESVVGTCALIDTRSHSNQIKNWDWILQS